MSYLHVSLTPDEELVHRVRLHWLNTAPGAVTAGLAIVALGLAIAQAAPLFWAAVVALVLLALYLWLPVHTTELGVTNRRFIQKTGIVARHTVEIRLDAIETVTLHQSVWGRLLNYGTVHITGRGEASLYLVCIAAPLVAKQAIERACALQRVSGGTA